VTALTASKIVSRLVRGRSRYLRGVFANVALPLVPSAGRSTRGVYLNESPAVWSIVSRIGHKPAEGGHQMS
jgi:hypothetical protein